MPGEFHVSLELGGHLYHVREYHPNREEDKTGIHMFRGTLSECYAYIMLRDRGAI